ncbi:hypothetical protein [Nonomuraea cavernae]|uniref:4Fe-4S Wbl-type domain-containing protein n=1 Tax=Nonomuraea cavernae TaxID=2045107 RepID=A0A917YQ64_9ACTN|nr:hypothetical protein [Nonomuraea cavernae]MCA2184612.1 hypothetical protein [Nonomuraea cavernae]GGO63269.1 hypothetical protein GCM10012289_09890 [Nonomuraea cavernae]
MTRAKSPTSDLARLRSLYDQITEEGLCTRPGVDPDHWFPDAEPAGNATTQRRFYEQAATARCAGCKALAACQVTAEVEERADLMLHDCAPHGIRGGLAPWARFERLLASNIAVETDKEEAA